MDETRIILIQMGFTNPSSNAWHSDWFGHFLLAKTATPMTLAEFIYNRGLRIGKEEAEKYQNNVCDATGCTVYVSDPNQRPIHIAQGGNVIYNLDAYSPTANWIKPSKFDYVVCPYCNKFKTMQGNGIIHPLCECCL